MSKALASLSRSAVAEELRERLRRCTVAERESWEAVQRMELLRGLRIFAKIPFSEWVQCYWCWRWHFGMYVPDHDFDRFLRSCRHLSLPRQPFCGLCLPQHVYGRLCFSCLELTEPPWSLSFQGS